MTKLKWLPVLMISAGLMSSCGGSEQKENTQENATTEQAAVINTTHAYICPMHCENSASMEPGVCKVCGMDLVKNPDYKAAVTDSTSAASGAIDDSIKVEAGHEGHNH